MDGRAKADDHHVHGAFTESNQGASDERARYTASSTGQHWQVGGLWINCPMLEKNDVILFKIQCALRAYNILHNQNCPVLLLLYLTSPFKTSTIT